MAAWVSQERESGEPLWGDPAGPPGPTVHAKNPTVADGKKSARGPTADRGVRPTRSLLDCHCCPADLPLGWEKIGAFVYFFAGIHPVIGLGQQAFRIGAVVRITGCSHAERH